MVPGESKIRWVNC